MLKISKTQPIFLILCLLLSFSAFAQDPYQTAVQWLVDLKNEHYQLLRTATSTEAYAIGIEQINEKARNLHKSIDDFIEEHQSANTPAFRSLRDEMYEFIGFTKEKAECNCYDIFLTFLKEYRGEITYIGNYDGVLINSVLIGNFKWFVARSTKPDNLYMLETHISSNTKNISKYLRIGLWKETEVFFSGVRSEDWILRKIDTGTPSNNADINKYAMDPCRHFIRR